VSDCQICGDGRWWSFRTSRAKANNTPIAKTEDKDLFVVFPNALYGSSYLFIVLALKRVDAA
jgi:hypothetical protein